MTRYRHAISYRLREVPIRQIKVWSSAQARKLDRTGIAELARSIRSEGLQNPPMVQQDGKNSYLLMSGQRRLAALKRLRTRKVPVLVLTKKTAYQLQDAKAASVIENIHRRNMNTRDVASACSFLAARIGRSKAAQSLGMSAITFRRYHGFAGVPERLKELVPKKLSRDQATRLYTAVPDLARALRIAGRMSRLDSSSRRTYLELLSRNPNLSHKTLMKRLRLHHIQKTILLKIPKGKAHGLAVQSRRHEMEPQELAGKILSDWLKRKGY
ncbi:MAG: ParB/RepB/Spo0J family partition protein [Thaumarchaeota archaeon]|nr:ParB/RepB/Spo0J family partition protein [Nitrososphaerota archaeon]